MSRLKIKMNEFHNIPHTTFSAALLYGFSNLAAIGTGIWYTNTGYVQLVIVIIIVMHIFVRYYSVLQYPKNYFLEYINSVKIMSVLLESCPVLPQMMLNYQTQQSTEGLSSVLVLVFSSCCLFFHWIRSHKMESRS